MPILVDSHCHIDMPQFDADREEVVARAREAGIREMLWWAALDEEGGQRRALGSRRSWASRARRAFTPTRRSSRTRR